MTYELAKELKDAEFPQNGGNGRVLWKVEGLGNNGIDDRAYAPTLSELISELGDKFGVLDRFENGTFGAYIPNDIGTNGLGATPEEALAKLWLALRAPNKG